MKNRKGFFVHLFILACAWLIYAANRWLWRTSVDFGDPTYERLLSWLPGFLFPLVVLSGIAALPVALWGKGGNPLSVRECMGATIVAVLALELVLPFFLPESMATADPKDALALVAGGLFYVLLAPATE